MAVFLGCTSTGRVGLGFMWFYVQELPKAQPAVVLVLKRLRLRGNGLKSHPTDWEKPGIEPATPGLQDIGLSPTPRRLLNAASEFDTFFTTKQRNTIQPLFNRDCFIKRKEYFKAAYSVTFDLLILELMFLFFKNTVK